MGEWTSAGGLSIMDKYAFTEGRPPNITLKVLSRIEEPFVMFRKVRSLLVFPNLPKILLALQTAPDEPEPTGNHRFEGFCVDLLEQIANQVWVSYFRLLM